MCKQNFIFDCNEMFLLTEWVKLVEIKQANFVLNFYLYNICLPYTVTFKQYFTCYGSISFRNIVGVLNFSDSVVECSGWELASIISTGGVTGRAKGGKSPPRNLVCPYITSSAIKIIYFHLLHNKSFKQKSKQKF